MELFKLPYKVKLINHQNTSNMINFSIVIIAKNEEAALLKILPCLTEFKNKGGEICLLDIGSSDDTISIANEWGCKIELGTNFTKFLNSITAKKLNDKFNAEIIDSTIIRENDKYFNISEAKNHIAEISSNDIVLMLDNVENLIEFNIDEILKYTNNGYNRFCFTTINNGKNKYDCSFYNKKKYSWQNTVKECLVINENEEIKEINLPESILKIEYHEENKISNTVLLNGLAIDCIDDLTNNSKSVNLAIELMNHKYFNSAIQEFNRHISICDSNIERSQSLIYIADCLIEQNRDKDALDYYNRAYLECSIRRYPLYKLGEYFFKKKIWDQCIFYLEGCLNIKNPQYHDDNPFHYADGPYSMLYVAYWWFGNKEKAKFYFDKALEIDPFNPIYLSEAKYHYEYLGNNIIGSLSFQELQFLYNESKNSKSVLEIGCNDGRGTHVLLNGCNGAVTVITKNKQSQKFSKNINNFGNIRMLNVTSKEAKNQLGNEKFDMIVINCDNLDEAKDDIFLWENNAGRLMCGTNYNMCNQTLKDLRIEVNNEIDNLWVKRNSQFQKNTVYKRKDSIYQQIGKKKIALCISGYLRTFRECWPSILDNVIQDHDVDIFIHTYEKLGHSSGWRSPVDLSDNIDFNFLETLPNLKILVTENQDNIKYQFEQFRKIQPMVTNINIIATIFYKTYHCNELKKQYEKENNFIYDLVIRTRGDQIFTKKIILNFPENKILINAYPWGDEDYIHHFQQVDTFGNIILTHENECLNDRFAVGNSANIDYLCELYNHFGELITNSQNVELEHILWKYLQSKELEKRNLFFYVKHNPSRLIKPIF